MSDEFPINRGVRKADPLSPKLFIAVIEEAFKKAGISEGINVDGKKAYKRGLLTMLLFSTKKKKKKKRKKPLKQSELRKSESWPTIHKEKTKYMTNHSDGEDILTDQEKKSDRIQIPRTNHTPQDTTKEEIYSRIRATWSRNTPR